MISQSESRLGKWEMQILRCKQNVRPRRRKGNPRIRIYTHNHTGENIQYEIRRNYFKPAVSV